MVEGSIEMVMYLMKKERNFLRGETNAEIESDEGLFVPMGTIYTSEEYQSL